MAEVLGTRVDWVQGVVAHRELGQKVVTELGLKKEHVESEFTLGLNLLPKHLNLILRINL